MGPRLGWGAGGFIVRAVVFDFGQTLVDSAAGFRAAEKRLQARLLAELPGVDSEPFPEHYRQQRSTRRNWLSVANEFPVIGSLDDTAVWGRSLDGRAIAAIAGLGTLAGIDLNNYAGIDAVLALDAPGQSAQAGNLTWSFTDTFDNVPDGETLTAGMNYIGTNGHYYIVLGGNAQQGFTGVWAVPEPGTFGLLLAGLLGLWVFGRRQR